ncbi:unnamed protein product [Orchesella dallaii]|uniref:CUB domain-containing protein n=1 Tax=Orchesella dallaii TaxID=48710 RepID=A0ABP1S8X4_9HEXA
MDTICGGIPYTSQGDFGVIRYKERWNYANNEDCVWLIELLNASSIGFTLEETGFDTCCDYVTVSQTDNEWNELPTGDHSQLRLERDTAIVSGPKAIVRFSSDESKGGTGFRLSFEKLPDWVTGGEDGKCGGVILEQSGVLNYKPVRERFKNEQCVWLLHSPNSTRITLKLFLDGFRNRYDYLEVSTIDASTGIIKYAALLIKNSALTIEESMVVIVFKSDYSTRGKGFSLVFSSNGTISDPEYEYNLCHISDRSGEIEYPNSVWESTGSGMNEIFVVARSLSCRAVDDSLLVTKLNWESGVFKKANCSCKYGEVSIYSASESSEVLYSASKSSDWSVIERFPNDNVTSSCSDVVTVTAKELSVSKSSMFLVIYKPVVPRKNLLQDESTSFRLTYEMDICGGVYVGSSGVIVHKFNDGYRNNEECVWLIEVPLAESILFELEGGEFQACCDYITVSSILPTSGVVSTEIVISPENRITSMKGPVAIITFSSDGSRRGNGFRLHFRMKTQMSEEPAFIYKLFHQKLQMQTEFVYNAESNQVAIAALSAGINLGKRIQVDITAFVPQVNESCYSDSLLIFDVSGKNGRAVVLTKAFTFTDVEFRQSQNETYAFPQSCVSRREIQLQAYKNNEHGQNVSISRSVKTGSSFLAIYSSVNDVYYDLAWNSKNTFTIRNLLIKSASSVDSSHYNTNTRFAYRDSENVWQPLNPVRTQVQCLLTILLFSFESLELKHTLNDDGAEPVVYLPYLVALNELEKYFHLRMREFKFFFQPAVRFLLHISVASQIDESTWQLIHSFRRYHNVNNGVIRCKPIQPAQAVDLLSSECLQMEYFCSTCSKPDTAKVSLEGSFASIWRHSEFGNLATKLHPLNLWTMKRTDYFRNLDFADYGKLKNVFLPPRDNSFVFRFAIIQLLVSSSNASLHLNIDDYSNPSPKIFVEKQLSKDYSAGFYRTYLRQYWLTVFVSSTQYSFFTCYTEDHLTISYYFQPFQQTLWIALLTCLAILAVLTHLLLILKGFNKPDFNAYFFAYSSFLEHSYHIPDYLFDFLSTRITLGLWLLISVIFTNAYKGIAITGVTAPPEKSSLNTFAELVEDYDQVRNKEAEHRFRIFSPLKFRYLDDWKENNLEKVNFTGAIGSAPTTYETDIAFAGDLANEVPLIFKLNGGLSKLYGVNATTQQKLALKKSTLYSRLQQEGKYLVPKKDDDPRYSLSYSIALEREIVQCHNRVVYIDNEDKVDREMEFLSNYYHYKNFFKSSETILKDFTVWQFDNGHGSKLPKVFKILIESGIFRQIELFYRRQEYLGIRLEYTRKRSTEEIFEPVKKLDLKSNVQTVFYLYFIGIFGVVGIICLEVLYWLFKSFGYCKFDHPNNDRNMVAVNRNTFTSLVFGKFKRLKSVRQIVASDNIEKFVIVKSKKVFGEGDMSHS